MNNRNNRLFKELYKLQIEQNNKNLLDNDFLIYFNEEDITVVHAIIKGPYESVYRHKFIRLDFEIPEDYPFSPPKVKFINHDSVRIHPNFYEDGKCCSTILNTWGDSKFEKWTSSMGIETILLMFHSFLDNNPYMYEPGGRDDPNYSVYVKYQSWSTCLLKYLQFEKINLFQQFIQNYLLVNIDTVFNELYQQLEEYPYGYYTCRCFEIDDYMVNYSKVIDMLHHYYNYINYTENIADDDINENIDFVEFTNMDYKCHICYDTQNIPEENTIITLHCTHTFHQVCLNTHITTNHNLCSMCRSELTEQDTCKLLKQECELNVNDNWIINPLTKRKVKIGSRTYKYLVENKFI
uniref:RING-type domain-containing protein n=1 Tax=viral metagenome TaxID=1070528 RepID=A0A6C0DX08_9ZZZZ